MQWDEEEVLVVAFQVLEVMSAVEEVLGPIV
jgi:hypothetical protein